MHGQSFGQNLTASATIYLAEDSLGRVSAVDIAELPTELSAILPSDTSLFTDTMTLHISTPQSWVVRPEVFDELGQGVETVAVQYYGKGAHLVRWSGGAMLRGVYLVWMKVDGP